jgi:hypothetical protein
MIIIGADYHPGFQQIAFVDSETGELQERRLGHCAKKAVGVERSRLRQANRVSRHPNPPCCPTIRP